MLRSLAALLVLTSCTAPPPEQPSKPKLRIQGCEDVLEPLVQPLTQTHARTVGSMDFDVQGGSTSDGIRTLLEGEADLTAASRPHLPAEQEQALAKGTTLVDARSIIAVDVVAVSVHESSNLHSLTYDQVIGIFCTRAVDSWEYLGMEDRPVRPLAREPLSGTRVLFEDFFCGPRGIHPSVEVLSDAELRRSLAEDPHAVGFVSLSNPAGKLLALRPDPDGPPVHASQREVISGSYPLYRDIYLYTAGPPQGQAAEFLHWVASPAGQEVVDEARYVPLFLRPERMDEPRPLRETVHFDVGSSVPNQRSQARLKLLSDELRERAGDQRHVILEGYTDPTEEHATSLSRARARAVQELLQENLPGLFFEIIPRGAQNPLAPNTTPYGRQRNRRVQVYLGEEEAQPADAIVDG